MAYALSGERPRNAAFPVRTLLALVQAWTRANAAARRRKNLRLLMELDEYRLWDLGIARNDLMRALRSEHFDIELVRDRRRGLDVWPPR